MDSIINIISTYFAQISNYFLFNKFPIFLLESLSLFNCHLQQLQRQHWPTNLCFGQHFWPIAAAVAAVAAAAVGNSQLATRSWRNWQLATGLCGPNNCQQADYELG